MPIFRYVAKDKAGKIARGQFEADNEKMVEKKLQEGGFRLIEASPKSSKKAHNYTKGDSFGNEEPFLESSMETHGQKQANNGVEPNQKSLQILKILIAVTLALIVIALWTFAR